MRSCEDDRVVAIIPARSDGSRLAGKHLRAVGGRPMLYYLVRRMRHVQRVSEVVVATTARGCDDELAAVAQDLGAKVFRGSLDDVVGRMAAAARKFGATVVVKANGDNPLQAPEVIAAGISQLLSGNVDLVTGKHAYTGLPVGLGAEIISRQGIEYLDQCTPLEHRDDTTWYAFEGQAQLQWRQIVIPESWKLPSGSITVDTPRDLKYLAQIIAALPPVGPENWTIEDILKKLREYERAGF